MFKLRRILATASLITAGLCTASVALAQNAQLSVLHGVPGLIVDVCVNDSIQIPGFTPGSVTGPLDLPAGTYTVEVFAAPVADCSGTPAIGPANLPLAAGVNYTAVAHLDATGMPTASLFANDTSSSVAGGKATVRHVAANAQGVEVVVNGSISLGTFDNGEQLGPTELAPGTYSAAVEAGGSPVAPTPVNFDVVAGSNTIVYAYGDPTATPDATFAIATQSVPLDDDTGPVPPERTTGIPTLGTVGLLLMFAVLLLAARRFV